MSKEELLQLPDYKLYIAMYDIFDKGSCEAVELFQEWILNSNTIERHRIQKCMNRIKDNERYIAEHF